MSFQPRCAQGPGPDLVSQVEIQQVIEALRSKARYLARFALSGKIVMSHRDFVWDAAARQLFKIQSVKGKNQ
jgi:hypothetical protein